MTIPKPLALASTKRKSLIARNPHVMSGSYCLRGTRIPVYWIKGRLRSGETISNIAKDYGLPRAMIVAAKNFRRVFALVSLAILMAGCVPPVKHPTPQEEAIASVEAEIVRQARRDDLMKRNLDLNTDIIRLALDCARVDEQTWKANRCGKRRTELLKRKEILDAEVAP